MKEKETKSVAGSATGIAPENWPTVWLSPDGVMQHRQKTNEMLEDYLNKDLHHVGKPNHDMHDLSQQTSSYQSLNDNNNNGQSLDHLPTSYEQLLQPAEQLD